MDAAGRPAGRIRVRVNPARARARVQYRRAAVRVADSRAPAPPGISFFGVEPANCCDDSLLPATEPLQP